MTSPSTSGAAFVRVTVLGAKRNGDLAIPTDVPVASVLPAMLDLLDEAAPAHRRELVTVTGTVIDPAVPLGQQAVADGAVLRLVAAAETPPEPIVYDMVDVAEDARPKGIWNDASRTWVIALLSLAGLIGDTLMWLRANDTEPRLVWLTTSALALAASGGFRALRAKPAAWVFAGGGVLAGAMALWSEHADAPYWHIVALGVAAVIALGWCAAQPVMAALTSCTLLACTGLEALIRSFVDDTTPAAAVVAVTLVMLCGLLPRAALTASGTFGADTAVTSGEELRRFDAMARVARAHWALAGAVLALAAFLAWNLYLLASESRLAAWPTALSCILIVVVALRARHFPLAIERSALWAAAGVGAFGLGEAALTRVHAGWLVPAAFLLLAASVLATSAVHPSPLQIAQGRRFAQRVETTALLTTLPLLLGVFGVYTELLDSFR